MITALFSEPLLLFGPPSSRGPFFARIWAIFRKDTGNERGQNAEVSPFFKKNGNIADPATVLQL